MKRILILLVLIAFGCGSTDDAANNGGNNGVNNGNNNGANNGDNNGANNGNNNGDNNGSVGNGGLNTAQFDSVLSGFVDPQGLVNYDGLSADTDALGDLQAYVADIGAASTASLSDDEKLAFYINAYNAIVILAVVDRLPLTSVMDVPGFFDEVEHTVAGKTMTLDALENEVIRVEFQEPRIHFALVCAAQSCPRLQQFAYTAANLEQKLHGAAAEFIPLATTIDGTNVSTSRIFDWFSEDFVAQEGSVGSYLAIYLPNDADVLNASPTITFTDYSWALNTQ